MPKENQEKKKKNQSYIIGLISPEVTRINDLIKSWNDSESMILDNFQALREALDDLRDIVHQAYKQEWEE